MISSICDEKAKGGVYDVRTVLATRKWQGCSNGVRRLSRLAALYVAEHARAFLTSSETRVYLPASSLKASTRRSASASSLSEDCSSTLSSASVLRFEDCSSERRC